MVIARLLTPAEIGVYSVVMVLLGFVATFRDLGAGQYLVQHKTLNETHLRSVWTVQLGLGMLFALLTFFSASAVAGFYSDQRMHAIMYVLAVNFAVTPFLAFPNAWLVREMHFGTLAIVRFTGALTHAGVAIGLALSDWGPISLAWANLATTLAGIIAIYLLSNSPAIRWPSLQGIRDVVSFGGRLTLSSLFDTIRAGAPELLLGRIQDLAAAGIFSRCQGLVSLFQQLVMSAVGSVALPFFAKENRAGRPLGPPFLLVAELLTGLAWPFFGILSLFAYPAIRILYGPQWDAAVEPTRWLAMAAAVGLPAMICSSPLIATGHVGKVLKASGFTMILSVIAVLIGVHAGLVQIAQYLVVASMISSIYWIAIAKNLMGFSWGALSRVALRSFLLAVASVIAPLVAVLIIGWKPDNLVLACLIVIPGSTVGFILAAWQLDHALWKEIKRVINLRKSGNSPD
jgi:O-antigen/teichoic acid export membrane protein